HCHEWRADDGTGCSDKSQAADFIIGAPTAFLLFSHSAFLQAPRAMLTQDPIEWPDEVEILVDELENESAERPLTRAERALMDVYETVPVLESQDCLHEFWQSGVNHQRIISS